MRCHVKFCGEVIKRLRTVTTEIGHQFDGDEEFLITPDGIGYHVEYELDQNNGNLSFKAVPGRFVQSNNGAIWINGKNRLHSEIEKNCDQFETSLLIH